MLRPFIVIIFFQVYFSQIFQPHVVKPVCFDSVLRLLSTVFHLLQNDHLFTFSWKYRPIYHFSNNLSTWFSTVQIPCDANCPKTHRASVLALSKMIILTLYQTTNLWLVQIDDRLNIAIAEKFSVKKRQSPAFLSFFPAMFSNALFSAGSEFADDNFQFN